MKDFRNYDLAMKAKWDLTEKATPYPKHFAVLGLKEAGAKRQGVVLPVFHKCEYDEDVYCLYYVSLDKFKIALLVTNIPAQLWRVRLRVPFCQTFLRVCAS